jgi:hypothetical protein
MKFVTPIFALILEPCILDVDAHSVFGKLLHIRFFRKLLVIFKAYSLMHT